MKLTKYQLEQAKTKTVKHVNGAEILKKENAELKEKMDEVDPWIYSSINNGVYKSGFAKS